MPNVLIDGPKIADVSVKRGLVKDITEALERAYGFPKQAYVVTINEHAPENVGVGGELIADKAGRED